METIEVFNGNRFINAFPLEKLSELNEEEVKDLAMGPQEDFKRYVQDLNADIRWLIGPENEIGYTDKWNWKPGTYNKIEKYAIRKLQIEKKARNISHLLDRTRDNARYMNYFATKARTMEEERARLKRLGISPTDNLDAFIEKMNILPTELNDKCNLVNQTMQGKVVMDALVSIRKKTLYLFANLNNLELNVYQENKIIQKIPLNSISIIFAIPLRPYLNQQVNKKNTNRLQISLKGVYHNDGYLNSYPYISYQRNGDGTGTSENSYWGNVCFDRYLNEINKCIIDNKYLELSQVLLQWAQYYSTVHSQPYNPLYKLVTGAPKWMTKEYIAIAGETNMASFCMTNLDSETHNKALEGYERDDYINNHCESIDCQIKEYCSEYKAQQIVKDRLNTELSVMCESAIGMLLEFIEDVHQNDNPRKKELLDSYIYHVTGSGVRSKCYRLDYDSFVTKASSYLHRNMLLSRNSGKIYRLKKLLNVLSDKEQSDFKYIDEVTKVNEKDDKDKIKRLMIEWERSNI